MADSILKQNAGRGGAVVVNTGGTLAAGEYVAMTTLGATTAIGAGITTPLNSGSALGVIAAGITINTLIVSTGSTNTVTGGPVIFYKGVTI